MDGGRVSACSRLLLLCSQILGCFSAAFLPHSSLCLSPHEHGSGLSPALLLCIILCPPTPPLDPPGKPLPLVWAQLRSPQSIPLEGAAGVGAGTLSSKDPDLVLI